MSLSAEPVKTFIVDDPRIDFDREAHYLVERSGGDVTYRTWKQVSSSLNAITFNTLVPSRDTAVSSKIYVKIPISVSITGADVGQKISDSIALRFAPFTSCCNSIQLELNGKQVSTNIYRYYQALMKYCNSQTEMTNDFSCMPTMMDTYSSYYLPNAGDVVVNQTQRAIRNPLLDYEDGSDFEPTRRKGYLNNIIDSISVDTNTEFSFTFELEEIIPLSPLFWGHREVKSLIGLDTLNISFQIRDLSRMFSSYRFGLNKVGVDTNLAFDFDASKLSGSVLEFIYIKPRANVTIPRTIHYPYNNIKDFSIQGANLGKGINQNQSGETQFSNIQLQGVPKRLYIFAKRQDSQETYYTPDTYARIDKITLDLGTRSGLLAECTPQALYRMAVKNGYHGSWDAWYKHVGSVLCIDFGSDVSLDLLDAPGALKQMQISFRLNYTTLYYNSPNPSANPPTPEALVNYTVYMIVVYDGMMIVKDGEVLFESNDVSALDVADSSKVRKLAYDDLADYVYGGMYSGGSLSKFISKAKSGLSKAKDFAQQKILPAAQKALPYVEKGVKVAADVLPVLAALGYTEEEIFDIVNGKGGKRMPKKSLKARAAK